MPPQICSTSCTLVETTTTQSYEEAKVGHLAPNAFLQSDLLLVHHVGFGREEEGRLGGWGSGVGQDLLAFLGSGWTSARAIRG